MDEILLIMGDTRLNQDIKYNECTRIEKERYQSMVIRSLH